MEGNKNDQRSSCKVGMKPGQRLIINWLLFYQIFNKESDYEWALIDLWFCKGWAIWKVISQITKGLFLQ